MSNPLKRAHRRATSAWNGAREGTARTATWVKEGVAGAPGKLRGAVSRGGEDSGPKAKPAPAKASGAAANGEGGTWERIGGAAALERARGDRRVAIAWIAGALLFVAWIGWTIYVWSENGSAAGVGVLVSWPAVLAALALVGAALV
ncbi:MAG: hypothetical protein FJW90_09925, partial [Actinobacteria bacterium]|nr:hypothetical protein [Actinomycetota bacterium]